MESVSIRTTQNVDINYKVAGIGDRVLAYIIDFFVLFAYVFAMMFFLGLTGLLESNSRFVVPLMIVVYLPCLLYDLLFEVFMNGQSIGKRAMKIRVVKLDNSEPSLGDYFLRWLLRIVDISLTSGGLAIITILINGKGQRVGDLAAGTAVVKARSAVSLDDTILATLHQDYQPQFAEVTHLTDADMRIIRKVLSLQAGNKIENHLAYKTKTALEEKMGIKSEMLPKGFLETVIKDYNYYAERAL